MVDLTFNGIINTSIEVGDLVYYTSPPSSVSGNDTTDNNGDSDPLYMGVVSSITTNVNTPSFTISIWEVSNLVNNLPLTGDYIFFAKDNQVGLSSLKGYYNNVVFENNSITKAEMFATSCEVTESSK